MECAPVNWEELVAFAEKENISRGSVISYVIWQGGRAEERGDSGKRVWWDCRDNKPFTRSAALRCLKGFSQKGWKDRDPWWEEDERRIETLMRTDPQARERELRRATLTPAERAWILRIAQEESEGMNGGQ